MIIMTLRRKFLMALVGCVCLMAILFSGIALASVQFLLGHAETYVQQGFKQQWTRTLTSYYMEHQSWSGVQAHVSRILDNPSRSENSAPPEGVPPRNPRFYVFDMNQTVVASSWPQDAGKSWEQIPHDQELKKQWSEINVNNSTVGYFWVEGNPRQYWLAGTIGRSIIRSMLIGLILTTLFAVIVGTFLTGRITGPLRDLTTAVRRVGKGDLNAHLTVNGSDDIAMLGHAFNKMTEQLARNEEVRRNMVADIAHELRTPLAVIYGKLESIQEGVLPSTAETLLPIQDETIRLSRLVQDLQQLSLAEAGKLPLHRKPMDLKLLLKRIFEQFAFEFEDRGIQAELHGENTVINADSDRLTQVFVNLIGNSLLHTISGGKISVTIEPWESKDVTGESERKGGGRKARLTEAEPSNLREKPILKEGILVRVQDTGEGIPEEDIDHIFNRFYRVDQSRDRETGGTGLGLAIAKEYVLAHGGEIQVASQVGKGTCFSVILPKDWNNIGKK